VLILEATVMYEAGLNRFGLCMSCPAMLRYAAILVVGMFSAWVKRSLRQRFEIRGCKVLANDCSLLSSCM
jgi:hypothetical protein